MEISVCIATFNGEDYIVEQLTSILVQIGSNDEVVISDDGSTDRTVDLIREFEDPRIKIFHFNGRNLIKNFENAIRNSSGKYIFLSDQDDLWASNKVKETMEIFDQGYDLINSDCVIINSEKEVIIESYFQDRNSRRGVLKNLIMKNSYMGCCMAFTSRLKDVALPFPNSIPMHDLWIGILGELKFKTYFLNKKLVYYRQHNDNTSFTATGISSFSLLKKAKFRLLTLYHLVCRSKRIFF